MRKLRLCMYLVDLFYLSVLFTCFVYNHTCTVRLVNNNAMLPAFKEGDYVVAKPLDEIVVGDIAIFTVGKEFLARRVVQDIQDAYITKGDAVPENDSFPMYKDAYVGTVIHVVKNGEMLSEWLHSPWLLLVLVTLTIIIWAA